MREVRDAYETERSPIVISGCIGPREDGYDPGKKMSGDAWQVGVLRDSGADFVSGFTMNNINEALGVARAAQAAEIPCVISFTVETDGRLPTGDSLAEAIEAVDAATGLAPYRDPYAIRSAPPRSVARLKVAIYIIAAGIDDKFHSSPARGSVTGQARGT